MWLDREGGTAWLLARDLATVETSDTAKDFVGAAAGINAAFITLYFSITLIVLSMAAGNLGVRLIDRWVERPRAQSTTQLLRTARRRAPREGYVEDVDIQSFCKAFSRQQKLVVVHVAPGQHVMKGERLISSGAELDGHDIKRLIPLGAYRSDNQGVVFRIRLIVETAARALSPAINDFYTALTCADKLAAIIESQTSTYIADDHVPAPEGEEWLILVGQDFRGLFADPLSAFRQAACQYPSVSIRMIDNYARNAEGKEADGGSEGLVAMLRKLAKDLSDHAVAVAQFDKDRHDIREAFAKGFEKQTGTEG